MHTRSKLGFPPRNGAPGAAFAALLVALIGSAGAAEPEALRVCADPNNMPQSHQNGSGYENRIAQELARDLGRKLEYTYFPQRMGFVRNTLRKQDEQSGQYKCDVIIGVPAGYELTATTAPYMRSTYALVFPSHDHLDSLQSADDLLSLTPAQLQGLRIGVFAQSPGADWLLRNRLIERAVIYAQQSGDPNENPTSIVERELQAGNIDVAIVWGPIAGFLVRQHSDRRWRSVPFRSDAQIKFDYEISMGVRFGEKEWQATLDEWIAGHRQRIEEILAEYRVPLVKS
jgi:quinoprotein dehydrogenase-associated probable ABC transporter substrate-binding protein